MKVIEKFKKFPILYFLTIAVALAATYACAFFLPDAYQDMIPAHLAPLMIITAVCLAYTAFLIGDVKELGKKYIIVITVISAVFGGGLFGLYHVVFNVLFKISFNTVMVMAQATQLVLASVLSVYLFILAAKYFDIKKQIRTGFTIALLAVTFSVCALPSCADLIGDALRKNFFLTEPSVFVSSDGYSIIFATSTPSTGAVTVTKDGVEKVYREEKHGVEVYDSIVHRVDIPKENLDNAEYYLSSRKTLDAAWHSYSIGKEITSKTYSFHPYSGDGDVSFLVVSDNQGSPEPTFKAVTKAYEKYDYDFVFMLGDHSETYNDVEKDIVNSFLKVSGLASGGEKPVYYTLGNHEYRGLMAEYLWDLIPSPSEKNEFYYTFTMGDAYFTVLNYGVDHDDDYAAKYAGIVHNNEYRDCEYNWYSSLMATKPYEGYEYNVVLSHIPAIFETEEFNKEKDGDPVIAYEFLCEECKKIHDYKWREFIDAFNDNGVDCMISGHTHRKPKVMTTEGCDFTQISTGSFYKGKTQFRNVIVRLSDKRCTYTVYSSED